MRLWCRQLGVAYRRKPITNPTLEKLHRLRELVARNPRLRLRELAVLLETSQFTVSRWLRKNLRLPPRQRKQVLNPEMENHLRLLAAKQPYDTYTELGRKLGVHASTVRNWKLLLGIPHHHA
jgi:hypothetical protein